MEEMTLTALWWAVIFSGLYHGINPGMGWPLAVSAALMERKASAMSKALAMLALGHFLAMIVILLPFSMLIFLVERETEIRIGAGFLVIAMGIYLLLNQRHPRFLARVHPAKLGLWSFLAAMAHGAGLMLVPIYLGICGLLEPGGVSATGHAAAQELMQSDIVTAFFGGFGTHRGDVRGRGGNSCFCLLLVRAEIYLEELVQPRSHMGAEPHFGWRIRRLLGARWASLTQGTSL